MLITALVVLTIGTGIVIWLIASEVAIGYAIGAILGIAIGAALAVAIIRQLGKRARRSTFSSNLFRAITKYKAAIYHIYGQQAQSATATVYNDASDYADLVDILKNQMKFQASIAKEAAQHAMDTASDKPIEEKVKVALVYLDGGNMPTTT